MIKRNLCFIFFCGLLCLGRDNCFADQSDCPFCDSRVLDAQTFYEDELVIALCTHKPVLPSHFLIIPKRHVERFESLSDEEFLQMGLVIKNVHAAASKVFGTTSYLLLQKNGTEVGQTVPHVHFHYIAREEGDISLLKFFYKMYMAAIWPSLTSDEIDIVVEQMKDAMKIPS